MKFLLLSIFAKIPKVKEKSNAIKNMIKRMLPKHCKLLRSECFIKINVPRATLQFRQGVSFRNKITLGSRPVLTDEEEQTLEDWIFSCHTKGSRFRSESVQIYVKNFLNTHPRPNPVTENLPSRRRERRKEETRKIFKAKTQN